MLISKLFRSFSSSNATRQRLLDKVCVITGGASGIGKSSAKLFAEEGGKIVVCDIDHIKGEETVSEIGNDNAIFIPVDVSKSEDIKNMINHSKSHFGKIDVLFNNAGIMHHEDDNAITTSDKVWDLTFDINVKSVFYGCKYGIPALLENGGGSIINTASFVALRGAATPQLAYTASKGAVLALTRELAVLHAKENIRINALCPGPLHTKLLMDFLDTEEKKQRRLVHLPMGRFGYANEMAKGALFLASDDSSYVTGTDFLVDGGLTAAYVTAE